MIVVVDYGMGNLGSIANMLRKIGAEATVSRDPSTIRKADRLILPGVGAFDNGMRNLRDFGLVPLLEECVHKEKKPILGICLGMQLFTKKSEEGVSEGLSWCDAETVRFRFDSSVSALKIPHMGWNVLKPQKNHPILGDMDANSRFYFVHSYHVSCRNPEEVLTTSNYGLNFVSMIQSGNIIGAQFHPEKSHRFGMRLLKNFAEFPA